MTTLVFKQAGLWCAYCLDYNLMAVTPVILESIALLESMVKIHEGDSVPVEQQYWDAYAAIELNHFEPKNKFIKSWRIKNG